RGRDGGAVRAGDERDPRADRHEPAAAGRRRRGDRLRRAGRADRRAGAARPNLIKPLRGRHGVALRATGGPPPAATWPPPAPLLLAAREVLGRDLVEELLEAVHDLLGVLDL